MKQEASLRAMVKHYLKRAREIETYLAKKPDEWGRFQNEFNSEVDAVFRNIMDFEKENLALGRDNKVYKLKQFFIKKIRHLFAKGVYCDWSIRKPYGYAGDFRIIDYIYENSPVTNGFDRLFDNYFQMSAISVAVRNRKEDFKNLLLDFIKQRNKHKLRIMNLASGPCREIQEILSSENKLCENVIFDCYDNDPNALGFAKERLQKYAGQVNFIRENAARIAFRKDITSLIDKKYDLIYSTGLFDYFNDRMAILTVRNLKTLLKENGILAIATVRDKYSNPSVHFMEWGGDWNLVYRSDDEFRRIFLDAGFKENQIKNQFEKHGIIQYIIAYNNKEG